MDLASFKNFQSLSKVPFRAWNFVIPAAAFIVFVASAPAAFAQSDESSISYRPNYDTGNLLVPGVRASIVGAGDFTGGKSATPGLNAAALVDFGRGQFSFETGVEAIDKPTTISTRASNGPAQKISLAYVGVPLLLKYNYIEKPMNAFSFKIGGMGAGLVADPGVDLGSVTTSNGTQPNTLNRTAAFALAGVTGTTALDNSNSTALVLDATYMYGLTKADAAGTLVQGLFVGAGIMFRL